MSQNDNKVEGEQATAHSIKATQPVSQQAQPQNTPEPSPQPPEPPPQPPEPPPQPMPIKAQTIHENFSLTEDQISESTEDKK